MDETGVGRRVTLVYLLNAPCSYFRKTYRVHNFLSRFFFFGSNVQSLLFLWQVPYPSVYFIFEHTESLFLIYNGVYLHNFQRLQGFICPLTQKFSTVLLNYTFSIRKFIYHNFNLQVQVFLKKECDVYTYFYFI